MATEPSPGTGTTETTDIPAPRSQRRRAAKRLLVIVVLIAAFIFLVVIPVINTTSRWLAQLGDKPTTSVSTPSGGKTTQASNPGEQSDPTTWKMSKASHKFNRWFAAGIKLIKTAITPRDARKAADYWLEGVKEDPVLLASASHLMLHRKVKPSKLVDKNGWATPLALETYLALKDLLAKSKIVVDEAPRSGWNTGIYQGKLVRAGDAIIQGDRKAIRITTPSGEAFWILGRCGNLATLGAPKIPKGPTDNEFCGPPKDGQGNPENLDLDGDGVGDGRIAQDVGGHKSSDTKTGAARGALENITNEQKKDSGGDQGTEYGSDNKEDPVTGPGADEGEGDSNNDRSVETTGF